jgi:shikimate dehydrogenase
VSRTTIGRSTTLCMSLSGRPGTFGSRFHNHLYEQLGLDFVYKAFATTDLPAAIGGVRALGIRGCSVSMPFKEACIPLLDALAPSAAAIESVNTIVNDGGRLTGHNTDYAAVVALLRKHHIAPETPVVLRGSGGMAKAVGTALRDAGFRRGTLLARNPVSGPSLARSLGFALAADLGAARPALLVNATPVGMAGAAEASELAFPLEAIHACEIAFDVVAVPVETPFVRAARAAGKSVITGADVIALQALDQFVLYTGVTPTEDQVARAAVYALG